MSNILITPIKIDGTHYCLQDDGLTVPILGGMASTTPKVVITASGPRFTGDNVFNVYQALGTTGDPPADEFRDDPSLTGSIKCGVHQCAASVAIRVYGRADTYGAGFDTLDITIDGVLIKHFESNSDDSPGSAPFSNTVTYDETVNHTFTTDIPCGHIVEISGTSGTFANNNVGYDVRITVTLPT